MNNWSIQLLAPLNATASPIRLVILSAVLILGLALVSGKALAQVGIPDIPANLSPGAIHSHHINSFNIRRNHSELIGPINPSSLMSQPKPEIEYEADDGLLLQMVETEDGDIELKRDGHDILIK